MKVKVKLYGTLPRSFQGYDPERGMEVELPRGASVGDLLALPGLTERGRMVVIVGGVIQSPGNELKGGAVVHVFEPVYGG